MTKLRFPLRFLAATFFIGTTLFVFHLSQKSPNAIDDSIDKALLQIPICNAEDRPRQRALLQTLKFWSQIARQSNLRYWISFGTLVGFVQNGGLLPYSVDLSINFMAQDTPRLIEISRQNFSSDFELKIQPEWFYVRHSDRQVFPQHQIDFVVPNARLINRKDNVHLDVYPSYDYDPSMSNSKNLTRTNIISNNLTEFDADFNWISSPRHWTFPLNVCFFNSIKLVCPAEPTKLVTLIFGPNALNSSETKCQNGTWKDIDE